MRKNVIKGSTTAEKFTSIEGILNAYRRHLNRYVIGALPPIPVFDFISRPDENGVILRRMFPGKGVISKGAMYIEEYTDPGKDIKINVRADGPLGGQDVKFTTHQQMVTINPNLVVDVGYRITISVDPTDSIKNIWISFLYEVGFKEMVKEKFLLDELLLLMEKSDAEEDEESTEETG